MGLDMLDFMIRVERVTGLKLQGRALVESVVVAENRPKGDITVAELCAAVGRASEREPSCARCRYDLRGHDLHGICPECGARFTGELCFEDARAILAKVTRCDAAGIRPESRVFRDLGMT